MRDGIVYDRGRLALARGDAADAVRLFSDFLGRTDPDDQLIRYTVRAAAGPGLRARPATWTAPSAS